MIVFKELKTIASNIILSFFQIYSRFHIFNFSFNRLHSNQKSYKAIGGIEYGK